MTKKQKSKYAGALLAPPQPSLFDNLEKGDELSNYDKEIFLWFHVSLKMSYGQFFVKFGYTEGINQWQFIT